MAMRLPKFFRRVTKPRTSSRSWIATVSVISTISRSATPGLARINDSMEAHQSGSMVVSGEMLRLRWPPGDRHDVGREQHAAVVLLHPHQAFVEGVFTRAGGNDRLIGHHDAPLVE